MVILGVQHLGGTSHSSPWHRLQPGEITLVISQSQDNFFNPGLFQQPLPSIPSNSQQETEKIQVPTGHTTHCPGGQVQTPCRVKPASDPAKMWQGVNRALLLSNPEFPLPPRRRDGAGGFAVAQPQTTTPKASPLNAREEDALCLLQRRQLFTQDKWSMSCCRWGNRGTEGMWCSPRTPAARDHPRDGSKPREPGLPGSGTAAPAGPGKVPSLPQRPRSRASLHLPDPSCYLKVLSLAHSHGNVPWEGNAGSCFPPGAGRQRGQGVRSATHLKLDALLSQCDPVHGTPQAPGQVKGSGVISISGGLRLPGWDVPGAGAARHREIQLREKIWTGEGPVCQHPTSHTDRDPTTPGTPTAPWPSPNTPGFPWTNLFQPRQRGAESWHVPRAWGTAQKVFLCITPRR